MANLTIQNLDDTLKARLRERAAANGRSMSVEAREILLISLYREPAEPRNLFEAIRAGLKTGGFALEIPPRDELVRDPPTFD